MNDRTLDWDAKAPEAQAVWRVCGAVHLDRIMTTHTVCARVRSTPRANTTPALVKS